jgi:hypothetical protein
MEALQVPKLVAVDLAEAVVELVACEVAVGVRVPDMAARVDMRFDGVNGVFVSVPRRCRPVQYVLRIIAEVVNE